MNRRIKRLFLALIIMIMFMLCGCSKQDESTVNENSEINWVINLTKKDLVYDKDTKIVYIVNYTYYGNYVYTPYYGRHGKICKYIDGEIVELY